MSTNTTAILHTPWDCKWSRFGRMRRSSTKAAEGLWVCVYDAERQPITAAQCETCPHWEYATPSEQAANCVCPSRSERRIEIGVRVTALALAVLLAGIGFVVLTRPLAIPLTISLWMGALTSFLLGIWGNFNRRSLPTRSW